MVRYFGVEAASTEVLLANAEGATINRRIRIGGQLTSVIPLESGMFAGVAGSAVLKVDDQGARPIADLPGRPYMLRAATGGLDVLVSDGGPIARAFHITPRATEVASGPIDALGLFPGREGRNVIVGSDHVRSSKYAWLAAPQGGAVAASLAGGVALALPASGELKRDGIAPIELSDPTGGPVPVAADTTPRTTSNEHPKPVEVISPHALALNGSDGTPPTTEGLAGSTASSTTPKCAVPRNDLRRQVTQPNSVMADWAVQQATRNALKGSVLTRPSNFANMGLPSYQPSNDFPRRDLHGWPGSPVPPSVIHAVFAQESAWKHASRRALPGISGNPTVSDYYGSNGTLDIIDYSNSDCGYGISQVTDCMTAAATCYTANGKAKVAVDYAENVAAGTQVLVDKWNQLWDAGVKLNDGDPQFAENWYFAVWAYNSGFHPFVSPSEPWGLGWTNNPQNADYCPCRKPFLRTTYADAETPASWPYQERIIGWMETPLRNYKGGQSYSRSAPDGSLTIPDFSTFCNDGPDGNECSESWKDPGGDPSRDFCKRADRKCWWHLPVTYASCPNACETSVFTFPTTAAEPANEDNYAPNCNLDGPGGAEEDPSTDRNPIIIDNQASPPLNVEGCSSPNWSSQGTFSVVYGTNGAGDPLGMIDWHQLGTGFGGHTWFTKNREQNDSAHINVGTWTPSALTAGKYSVRVHVPRSGASTSQATYNVDLGNGNKIERIVDQHLHENRWVSLGTFDLQGGAKVELSNVTSENPGTTNVAFDSVAFIPVSGDVITRTVDAVAIFDENQNIDADLSVSPPWANTTVLETMEKTYVWAKGRTVGDGAQRGVTGMPVCVVGFSSTCVGRATHLAFDRWGARVIAAGPSPQSPQAADTQPRWLGFSTSDPPALVTDAWLANPDNWKLRTRITASFLVSGGRVDPESLYLNVYQGVGHSHLPEFVTDIMRAYRDDYGIPIPDLTYTAKNLSGHNHGSTTVDPAGNGIAPGRAYFGYSPAPTFSADGACVRGRSIGGGVIGLKPMVHAASVRSAAQAWVEKVEAEVESGRAPEELALVAEDIRKLFFKAANVNPAVLDMNSPFWAAPAIWVQLDADFCADGTVRPGSGAGLAVNSYMPDLYLYIDGLPVDARAMPSAATPVATGDFQRFSHPPSDYNPAALSNPWDQCTFDSNNPNYRGRRNGSPWPVSFTTSEDEIPNAVRLCDSSYFPPDFHFDP